MKKLSLAVDRFAARHPNFGIPELMRYIIFGQAAVYVLSVFSNAAAVRFLAFDWFAILHGEIWRLVTFVFMPGYSSAADAIWVIFFLYLYYMIGTTLERQWGTAKFNLYYLSGVVLTILVSAIASTVSGYSLLVEGTSYVNLSMFFAFAMLYPDTQFLIMLIIPVKVKWLAWLDAALFAWTILQNLLALNFLGALLPVVALLNFFVFFWTSITDEIAYRRGAARHQVSAKTIQFKSAVRRQRRKEAKQGFRHQCAVCGRTDADYPDLEFRYCSRCAGYHCFCADHIFNHEHFTQ